MVIEDLLRKEFENNPKNTLAKGAYGGLQILKLQEGAIRAYRLRKTIENNDN